MRSMLEMVVNNSVVPSVYYGGNQYYVVEKGDIFSLKINNYNREKVVAIISIDGLSVMNGEPAKHSDQGYIIPPYGQIEVEGYRRGLDKVKQFVVGEDKEDSYVNKRFGSTDNVGVIGIVIKPEKRKVVYRGSGITRGGGQLRSSGLDSESVGTKMGNEVSSQVREVDFEADESRKTIHIFYYNTVEGLKQKGIPVPSHLEQSTTPNAFPGEKGSYCPDA